MQRYSQLWVILKCWTGDVGAAGLLGKWWDLKRDVPSSAVERSVVIEWSVRTKVFPQVYKSLVVVKDG